MTFRETGAAAIWAAEHDMPCEWPAVPQADQEMYLRMFDAAVAAYTLLAAERGWHMVPEQATRKMQSNGRDTSWHQFEDGSQMRVNPAPFEVWSAMLAAAPKFEVGG